MNRLTKIVLVLLVLSSLATGILYLLIQPGWAFGSQEGMCQPVPKPFEFVSGVFGQDQNQNSLFIARGIIGSGDAQTLEKGPLSFPPCWSSEKNLENVTNLFVTIPEKGNVLLIVGVIGRQQAADQPAPLPDQ